MSIDLSSLDYSALFGYFVLVFIIAVIAMRRERRAFRDGDGQSTDYFLAGKDLPWFLVGASLFASNIGSEHLIGLAGAGASSGLPVAQFEILAGLVLLLLGWFFVPFYLRSGVTTMPEFLELRYSKTAKFYLSIISVLAYVLTKISVTIYAGAVVFEAMGIPFWWGAGIVVVTTGLYTIIGGLRAVIYTDMMQMFVMIGGALMVFYFGLEEVGGYQALKDSVPTDFFSLWRSSDHPEFPWSGILLGAPILGVWYWCTDQFVVQRVLSAKGVTQGRRGSLFAAYLKQLPLFIFVIPGIICYALVAKGELVLPKSDLALPTLIGSILPSGVKGIVLAGLLAALMSSLSSVFNSCSTLITYDFYRPLYPNASEKKLVRFGQVATVFLVILGLAWIPMMGLLSGQLFTYIQKVQAYIAPPIAAVFLLGITFKRLNNAGALAAMGTGFVLGVGRLVLEIFQSDLGGFWLRFSQINFLHFAFILFVFCSAVFFIVSLLTEAPRKNLSAITFDFKSRTPLSATKKTDLLSSSFLLMIIFGIWYIYR